MLVDESDLKLITSSGLFDAEWYLANYPDVEKSGLDPAEHFLWIGGKLGRNPSSGFDSKNYLENHPTIADEGVNPLVHYLKSGGLNSASALLAPGLNLPPFAPGQQYPFRPHLQRLVDRVRARIAKERNGPDYEEIERLIDLPFYVQRYPDLAKANANPVLHYINHGRRERRQLWPHLVPKTYISNNPELNSEKSDLHIHYLKEGRKRNLATSDYSIGSDAFEKYCATFEFDPVALERRHLEKIASLRDRLERGTMGEMVAKAAQLEPLISQAWLAALTPGISPLRSESILRFMTAMKRMHIDAEYRPAKAVVLIPWCHVSGATRVAGFLSDALARIYNPSDVVIIRTETSEMDFPEWFPSGARHVDFAAHAQGLKDDVRHRLLISILRSLQPEAIFNVNSLTFWDSLGAYGTPLNLSSKIYSYLFCSEVDIYGNVAGYPVRHFQPTFNVHNKFFTDSEFLLNELSGRFILSPHQSKKIVKLPTPLSSDITQAPTPVESPDRPRQVFWAGRFDRQKRVDIVYEIARQMPDVTFRMWGKAVLDRSVGALEMPSNVRHEGSYQAFSELPLDQCDAWLYTSEWDGVPNILLDVASAGIPLVGSLAGGTSEVLRPGVSWPVSEIENISDYVGALRAIFSDPSAARVRSTELRRQIVEERTIENYTDMVLSAMENSNA